MITTETRGEPAARSADSGRARAASAATSIVIPAFNEAASVGSNDTAVEYLHRVEPAGLDLNAIDMALAVLRHGRNPQIRRLAQEIIVTQQQEIAVMRLAVGQPLPSSAPSPTQVPPVRPGDSNQFTARAMEP